MKFNPIQTDFSSGEISDRAIGHSDSATYKAAVARAYNMLTTQSGSIASRGGGQYVGDFTTVPDITNGAPSSLPSQPGPVLTYPLLAPGGSDRYVLAIKQSPTVGGGYIGGIDIFDRKGRTSLYYPFDDVVRVENWQYIGGTGLGLDTGPYKLDVDNQRMWLFNTSGTALDSLSVSVPTGTQPIAGNGARYLKFTTYGDDCTITVRNATAGVIFGPTVLHAGDHSITLIAGNRSTADNLSFTSVVGAVAATIIDNIKFYDDPMGIPTSDTLSTATSMGIVAATNLNTIKHCSFYFNDTAHSVGLYFNIFCIPGKAPFILLYTETATPTNRSNPVWSLGTIVAHGLSTAQAQSISSCVSYQERLWLFINDDSSSIKATATAYFLGAPNGISSTFEFGTIGSPPLAAQALDLKLQSPSGRIVWAAVLRGLIMGTTRKELLFSLDQALALDPTNGQTFDVTDHSAYGADPALPAITARDKVVWVQQGRQKVLQAGIRIETDTGLVAEDIGIAADHLLDLRVRSLCYMKTKTPRYAFALDDGSIAIATLAGKGIGWSRIQLGGFPNILRAYSVCAVEAVNGTELWIGTENSTILRIPYIESNAPDSSPVQSFGATPAASGPPVPQLPVTLTQPNYWETPVVIDCYRRRPVEATGTLGVFRVTQLPYPIYPVPNLGQTYAALLNGIPIDTTKCSVTIATTDRWCFQWNGPGNISAAPDFDVGVTWTDRNNVRQPSEMIVGLAYPNHKIRMLPQEGGSPSGTALGYKKRRLKIGIKLVDSYVPLVNGARPDPITPPTMFFDGVPVRVNPMGQDAESKNLSVYDFEITESDQLVISQDLPLRVEVAAVFSATTLNSGAGE